MKTAKEISFIGVFIAILIAAQFVLHGISGVEIVTVLFAMFCYKFGVKKGVFVATAFSILRCFIFGFFANVIILYLVYYNLFAIVFGLLKKTLKEQMNFKVLIILTILAVVMTAFFTLLDGIITPALYGYTIDAMKSYITLSLYTMVIQMISSAVTVIFLGYPIYKVLNLSFN